MANVTIAAVNLSTIELIFFNSAIFSAINRIRYILTQLADINWVLNEMKKGHLQNHLNKLITEKKIINKINHDKGSYRINRDISKSHEFDQAQSPVSLSNSSFNNSLSSILPPLTIENPSPTATFNITERPTAAGTLLIDTSRNLSHPATASLTDEAIGDILEKVLQD